MEALEVKKQKKIETPKGLADYIWLNIPLNDQAEFMLNTIEFLKELHLTLMNTIEADLTNAKKFYAAFEQYPMTIMTPPANDK